MKRSGSIPMWSDLHAEGATPPCKDVYPSLPRLPETPQEFEITPEFASLDQRVQIVCEESVAIDLDRLTVEPIVAPPMQSWANGRSVAAVSAPPIARREVSSPSFDSERETVEASLVREWFEHDEAFSTTNDV